MLNKFTYQLELNNLNQCTTKPDLKAKIVHYNSLSFCLTSSAKITLLLRYYIDPNNQAKIESKLLYYELLQLTIAKYVELYDITELPQYAQYLNKFKINITLKDKHG